MLKVHTYINLTQTGVDSYTEIEKINLGLNSANIILDALELVNAENTTKKIQLGTRLGFDAAGFTLGASS
ncbi:hypothetical protein [Fluviispira sanaruensis]|uniref:Uncharacterized protein n=1 Tax=Fluviispira sanaruensis TaxID=2493639 RepID=A0A4P2VKL5_FLUSA|nr:hypothetical protein [Fluviispira sanaruensis]BBH53806.1 hypothetical protein JCM31447_22560 [Fluviispira sanaruensis]